MPLRNTSAFYQISNSVLFIAFIQTTFPSAEAIYSYEECIATLFVANSSSHFLLCSSAALLCADWKILSFISLLLPATGAGSRIHARGTMQLRRFETKEVIRRQHLASLNKEIASTIAEKWSTAGGAAQSWLTVSHRRAHAGSGRVSVLFQTLSTCSFHRFRLIRENRSQSMPDMWLWWLIIKAAIVYLFFFVNYCMCLCVLTVCQLLPHRHTNTHLKSPHLPSQLPWTQKHRT